MKFFNSTQSLSIVLGCVIGLSLTSTPLTARTKEETIEMLAGILSLGKEYTESGTWEHGHAPRQRDPLFMPSLRGLTSAEATQNGFNISLFLSRAPSLAYTINDMIPFKRFFRVAKLVCKRFAADPSVKNDAAATRVVRSLFDSFEKLKLQEHNLGLMVEKRWDTERFYFSAATWFGFAERNYWLDTDERQNIDDQLSKIVGQLPPPNLDNLYTIKFGIGDLLTEYGAKIIDRENVRLSFAGRLTLPLSRKKNRETKQRELPVYDLTEMQTFMIERMREIFIMPSFGNEGHWMLGAGIHGELPLGDNMCVLKGSFTYDYRVPATTERFFLAPRSDVDFDLTDDLTTNDLSPNNEVQEVRNTARQYLVPDPVGAIIAPGDIYNIRLSISRERGAWNGTLGYDFYYEQAEEFGRFALATDETKYLKDLGIYPDTQAQHKIFAGIGYTTKHKKLWAYYHTIRNVTATWGLSFEKSLAQSGIGDDFTIALRLTAEF